MAMVNLPAARRHHRSRITYAFGLLALVGAATTLVVVVRYPAQSSTELTVPVPAPEITVVDEDGAPPDDDPGRPDEDVLGGGAGEWAVAPPADDADPLAGPHRAADGTTQAAGGHTPDDISRSLFYSGVLGLAISLAGLGLVGTRRRMW
jgi:hypothetical protein